MICVKCKEREAKPNQRHCKECHKEYMRKWRAKEKVQKKIMTDIIAKIGEAQKVQDEINEMHKALNL